MKIKTLIAAVSLAAFGAANAADYEVPRTEWDQPDLQGVWNFSSNTPMQRNRRFGEQEFLTAEEVEAERARVVAAAAAAEAIALRVTARPGALPRSSTAAVLPPRPPRERCEPRSPRLAPPAPLGAA